MEGYSAEEIIRVLEAVTANTYAQVFLALIAFVVFAKGMSWIVRAWRCKGDGR